MENWRHGVSKCTQPVGGEPGFHSGHVALEPQGKKWERNKRRHSNTDNDASKQKAVSLLRHFPFSGHIQASLNKRWRRVIVTQPLLEQLTHWPWSLSCQHRCGGVCAVGGAGRHWGGRCWRWDMSLRLTLRRLWSPSAGGGVFWLPGGVWFCLESNQLELIWQVSVVSLWTVSNAILSSD